MLSGTFATEFLDLAVWLYFSAICGVMVAAGVRVVRAARDDDQREDG